MAEVAGFLAWMGVFGWFLAIAVGLIATGAVFAAAAQIAAWAKIHWSALKDAWYSPLPLLIGGFLWVLPVFFWNGWALLALICGWGFSHWMRDPDRVEEILAAVWRVVLDLGAWAWGLIGDKLGREPEQAPRKFYMAGPHVREAVAPAPSQFSALSSAAPRERPAPIRVPKLLREALMWLAGAVLMVFALGYLWSVISDGWRDFVPWAESRDELRGRAERAEIDLGASRIENGGLVVAIDAAERTHKARERVARVVEAAKDSLHETSAQNDLDALGSEYLALYRSVWDDAGGGAGSPDPSPRRAPGMHASRAGPA